MTPPEDFILARKLNAIINLDDINHIDYLERLAGLPETIVAAITRVVILSTMPLWILPAKPSMALPGSVK